jgi:hypothetical protein
MNSKNFFAELKRRNVYKVAIAYAVIGWPAANAADMMNQISAEIIKADDFVTRSLTTFFRFQIALTLTIEKHKLPSRTIPLRYNFPNDPGFDQKYPNDLSDVRILHYLRCEVVHRERDFVDLTRVAALIQRRDLRGSNEVLRRCVEELYPAIKREEDR